MTIKLSKEEMKMLAALMPTGYIEEAAMMHFKNRNMGAAYMYFGLLEVSIKVAKNRFAGRCSISMNQHEACMMLYWCMEQRNLQHDAYALNVLLRIGTSLDKQLTNYRKRF